MDALIFEGPGRMAMARRPVPAPGPGELLVDVRAAGICGSELASYTGHSTRRPVGRIFGHELSGVVRAAGSAEDAGLAGRAVAINPLVSCGSCAQCLAGRANVCPSRTLLGMQVEGGFCEQVVVPVSAVRELRALDDVAGTLVEPIANAVHVLTLLPLVTGAHVAVLGAGPIGLSVLSVLRGAGTGRITVVDPVEERRALALAGGADAAVAPGEPLDEPDHVVDAAGAGAARAAAIELCAPGGTIVLLGLHEATSELPVNAAIAKELALRCSFAYTQRDFDVALALLERGAIDYRGWISERPLSDGAAAFADLVERPGEVTKIVLRP